MALEQLSERTQERSQQVIGLLSELSERLRKAESERDTMKREMLTIRECIQDLNDRNDQTEKAIVAIENRFDSTETQFEGAIRRLGNMEESVDKQSTELLAILRKIEERFDQYDREYKNHASSIAHYGDTLDRFDKKLEKLMQDKGRMARKIDALEFELADTEDRLQTNSGKMPYNRNRSNRDMRDNSDTETRATSNNWVATVGVNDDEIAPHDQNTVHNTSPTPPRVKWKKPLNLDSFSKIRRTIIPFMIVFILTIVLIGGGITIAKNPDKFEKWTQISINFITKIITPHNNQASPIKTTDILPSFPESTIQSHATNDQTSTSVISAGKNIPDKNFFSPVVRLQIDDQVVVARKLEDNDTARLMAIADKASLKTRIKRDTALPRAIQAIEDKALSGNAEAQHDMGALYTSGKSGVAVDYARAVTWFQESARNGMANARYNLGVLAQQGLGTPKDIDVALSWYRTAALLEHPEARYNLGIAYLEGIGVSYNPGMAAGYFEQAAKAGVIEAAYNLGLILENGLIDEPRPFEGLFWYRLGMDGGSNDAARSFTRLSNDLKINTTKWKKMFTIMIAERPDVKQLADSRMARSISLLTDAPTVRIHQGGKTPPTSQKPVVTEVARVLPPPAPIMDTASIDASMTEEPTVPKQNTSAKIDAQMIARIQTILFEDGFYKGDLDGQIGPGTINAIRRYQTKHNMTVDGSPTTDLLARMIARRLSDTIQPAAGDVTQPVITTDKKKETTPTRNLNN